MLRPYALVSLSEFKDTLVKNGTGRDDVAERAINTASALIETETGYRLRYRAPEEVSGAANVVAAVTLDNGTLTIAAQPDSAGRTLIVTLVDTERKVDSGTLTVTGTVGGTAGQTEAFNLADGPRLHGRKFFTAISSVVVADYAKASSSARTVAVGTSEGMVEYHTVCSGASRIRLMERVYAVGEVNEDQGRDYDTTTALVEDTDYEVAQGSTLVRVTTRSPWSWVTGYRAIKVRYSGGFGALSTVPDDLRDICIRVAGGIYQEWTRGMLGIQSQSDQLGNFTRFTAARLSDDAKDDLAPYRRGDIFSGTGERDFDEAAV